MCAALGTMMTWKGSIIFFKKLFFHGRSAHIHILRIMPPCKALVLDFSDPEYMRPF